MAKRATLTTVVAGSLALAILVLPSAGEARSSYKKMLKRETRHDRVYELKNFEPRIIWHATHLTRQFVEAQVDRLADELNFADDEKADELQSRLVPLSTGEVFFVSFFTIDRVSNRLAQSHLPQSRVPWKVELSVHPESWLRPSSIEPVRVTGFERFLYPYLDRWSEGYWVIFPKPSGSPEIDRPFKLRLLGLGESSTLVFDR